MLGRIGLAIVVSALLGASAPLCCVRSPLEPPRICERFWRDEGVALADVVNIQEQGHVRRVTLRLVETYRGQQPVEITVEDPRTDCGANFGMKGLYLAWFSRTKSGRWQAYGDRADRVADDIRYARSMKNPPGTGRIYGTLDKPKHSPLAPILKHEEPLPDRKGITVVAQNESGRFSGAVGNDLHFDLPTLPPGKYKVRVEGLPPDLAVDSQEIEVHGGGCNELILFSASSASVSGRVAGSGQPPRFAQVFLISTATLGKSEPSSLRWVMTDGSSGAFQFKHVEPGKYVLGFELGHSPTLDVPYASRYYPEGREATEATVVEVHAGEQIGHIEFNVGGEVARRRVRVRITWANGSPAINATAYLRDAHNPYSSVADEQTLTNANGEALLEGFVDTDYDVAANAVCKGRSISNAVETKVISASAGDAFVQLTVKGRKCPLADWRHTEEEQ